MRWIVGVQMSVLSRRQQSMSFYLGNKPIGVGMRSNVAWPSVAKAIQSVLADSSDTVVFVGSDRRFSSQKY